LTADRIERAEDHNFLVEALLHYRFQASAKGERRFTGTGATAKRNNSDLRI
jgi:hypothetical protein